MVVLQRNKIKQNQMLYYCAPKSWSESWPTLSAAHWHNKNREK